MNCELRSTSSLFRPRVQNEDFENKKRYECVFFCSNINVLWSKPWTPALLGNLIKVFTPWYVRKHRAKSQDTMFSMTSFGELSVLLGSQLSRSPLD